MTNVNVQCYQKEGERVRNGNRGYVMEIEYKFYRGYVMEIEGT